MRRLRKYTIKEVLEEANFLLLHEATTREVSKRFKMPQATVSWHMRVYLKELAPGMAEDIRKILLSHTRGRRKKR